MVIMFPVHEGTSFNTPMSNYTIYIKTYGQVAVHLTQLTPDTLATLGPGRAKPVSITR